VEEETGILDVYTFDWVKDGEEVWLMASKP